jgi:acid phosphatase
MTLLIGARNSRASVILSLLLIAASACSLAPVDSAKIGNVGDAKALATAYHDDGAYQRDLAAATAPAETWLEQRTPQVMRPALVLDIDETSLSNWAEIRANDFGFIPGGACEELPRGPCGWIAWERLANAPAISSTLELYREARVLHVAVFFVTGRHEAERPYTERNLRAAGYAEWQHLYMEPDGAHYRSAADFKSAVRAEIELAHYTIIANIGDQPSDLAGGHAERGFLLPDPFYRVP